MVKPPPSKRPLGAILDDNIVPKMVQLLQRFKRLPAAFYQTQAGNEPVRDWLKQASSKEDRVRIGTAIKRVEIEWPIGRPTCAPLSDGLWEIRVKLANNRTARVIFCVHDETMVLLHGFIKKTGKVPQDDLDLATKRKRDVETAHAKGKT